MRCKQRILNSIFVFAFTGGNSWDFPWPRESSREIQYGRAHRSTWLGWTHVAKYNLTVNMLLCGSTSRLCSLASVGKCFLRRASISTHYLQRGKMSAVAYRHMPGENPGVIFLPGFQSNMQGVKALALESYCRERGLAYTRLVIRWWIQTFYPSGSAIDGTLKIGGMEKANKYCPLALPETISP